jgi:hypothetical protein
MNNFSNFQGREKRISNLLEDLPVGIISFDADGVVDFVNPAFIKMGILFDLKNSSLAGTNILEKEIIPGVSLAEEIDELKKGFPFEKEIKSLKTSRGSALSLIIKGSSYYEDEEFAGGILVLEDLNIVSEARHDDLIKKESLKSVLDEIADLFFITDKEGEIKYSAGSRLSSISPKDSKNIIKLIPGMPTNLNEILANVSANPEGEKFNIKHHFNDEPVYYECTINPLSGKQPVKYLFITFKNISDKVKSEKLEDRLKLF